MSKEPQAHEEHGVGFLITCDKNREKQAVKDAYNFINEVHISLCSTLKIFMVISKLSLSISISKNKASR